MSNVYYLRPDSLSNEIVKCLQTLHTQARRGVVSGIAFVAYVEGYGYIVNSAGKAYENPTMTIGMLTVLQGKLAQRVDGGNP